MTLTHTEDDTTTNVQPTPVHAHGLYERLSREQLYKVARKHGIVGRSTMTRPKLIDALRERRALRPR